MNLRSYTDGIANKDSEVTVESLSYIWSTGKLFQESEELFTKVMAQTLMGKITWKESDDLASYWTTYDGKIVKFEYRFDLSSSNLACYSLLRDGVEYVIVWDNLLNSGKNQGFWSGLLQLARESVDKNRLVVLGAISEGLFKDAYKGVVDVVI